MTLVSIRIVVGVSCRCNFCLCLLVIVMFVLKCVLVVVLRSMGVVNGDKTTMQIFLVFGVERVMVR